MNVKTYRANSMQEALALVRRDLGPQASVLRTREVRTGGLLRWLSGSRQIEVVASTSITVPSRLPSRRRETAAPPAARAPRREAVGATTTRRPQPAPPAPAEPQDDFEAQLSQLQSKVNELCRRARQPLGSEALRFNGEPTFHYTPYGLDASPEQDAASHPEAESLWMPPARPSVAAQPDGLFRLFAELIEADVNEDLARELVERAQHAAQPDELSDLERLKGHVARLVQDDIATAGPIRVTPGRRHLVALVGPTGVGKTTTIAKLAANYRLREKQRVGLITVDTYRIAAVEQLRTYADIIDLPMEIVATPREMHQAVARMADLDLILMDTAGRSPRDDVKIQELKSLLAEAAPDEVHLVLSSVASANSLAKTAEQFATVGTTALILTKLDEAASLGNLLPLMRGSRLPLSYLTHGQNVPDDILPAEAGRLARAILGLESIDGK